MTGTPADDFVRQLTRSQDRLYAYIRTLLPQGDAAREVLQETNVVLLRKSTDPEQIRDFNAFAFRIAYFEVLSYRRNRARDRNVFDDQLMAQLVDQANRLVQSSADRVQAMEECVKMLPPQARDLLAARYEKGRSVKELAKEEGRRTQTIATQLFRIRQQLLDCIERKLFRGEAL
jgi:RNA polymerase sigma-70 factor (ECF subfamily)